MSHTQNWLIGRIYQVVHRAYHVIVPYPWRVALWQRYRHAAVPRQLSSGPISPPASQETTTTETDPKPTDTFWGAQYRADGVATAGFTSLNTADASWAAHVDALNRLGPDARAAAISALVLPFLRDEGGSYRDFFESWEREGFHITPNHYDQSIPDTADLPDSLWEQETGFDGIDVRVEEQHRFARDVFPRFHDEYALFPHEPTGNPWEFYVDNQSFIGIDPYVLHCMVRHFKPGRIVEVGSGFSSLIMGHAAELNGNVPTYTAIDPFPNDTLRGGIPGLSKLLIEPIEKVSLAHFQELESGDILFIDSSHVVKLGGDVTYLFLEVLPRLAAGVVVHVHDIFLPLHYPRTWVKDGRYYSTEQYLLQAFLSNNSAFEVLFANHLMSCKYPDAIGMLPKFPHRLAGGSSSFWMRRKGA